MSFLSDYTEKNSNLIPKIDIPCFAWNSQAEQGFLFFKAKSLFAQPIVTSHLNIRIFVEIIHNELYHLNIDLLYKRALCVNIISTSTAVTVIIQA